MYVSWKDVCQPTPLQTYGLEICIDRALCLAPQASACYSGSRAPFVCCVELIGIVINLLQNKLSWRRPHVGIFNTNIKHRLSVLSSRARGMAGFCKMRFQSDFCIFYLGCPHTILLVPPFLSHSRQKKEKKK